MENKGKLILTEIFPSVQKHDIFLVLRVFLFDNHAMRTLKLVIYGAALTKCVNAVG